MIHLILREHQQQNTSPEQPVDNTYQGWMNYRVTTRLRVEEDADAYIITTHLPGIQGDSLQVTWQNDYLIISGHLRSSIQGDSTPQHKPTHLEQSKVGRYVRHVPLRKPVQADQLQFASLPDGQLMIRVPLAS